MKGNVIVTGATERLGGRVVADLTAAGWAVAAVARDAKSMHTSGVGGARAVACDLADAAAVSRLAEKCICPSSLVHLAAGRPDDVADHATCTSQIVASVNLIASLGSRLDHVVLGSCTSICANQDVQIGGAQVPPPESYHGASQLAAEKLWNLFAMNSGKLVTSVRLKPFSTEADLERASRALLSALEARRGGRFGA